MLLQHTSNNIQVEIDFLKNKKSILITKLYDVNDCFLCVLFRKNTISYKRARYTCTPPKTFPVYKHTNTPKNQIPPCQSK